jgi:hypothetical protein
MSKTYTVEQIKNYILSQDSLGDVLYYLSEENIDKANEPKEEDEQTGYEHYSSPFK